MSDPTNYICIMCGQRHEAGPTCPRPSELAPPRGSAIRPHAEQTPLERVLRSHLWQPQDQLARAKESLPKHVKRKEYREAADCQDRIWKAESEIKDWEYLLELYEQERKSPNAKLTDAAVSDAEKQK